MDEGLKSTRNSKRTDGHFLHPWQDLSTDEPAVYSALQRANGIYVHDSKGQKLIDGPGGMWCVNVGHGREEIIEAVTRQMRDLTYFSPWSGTAPITEQLAERLAALAPGDLNNVFFTTGGSTAVDSALRFVYFYNNCLGRPDKKHVIARVNAYHGSTYLSASCSGKLREKVNMDMVEDRVHLLPCPKPKDRPSGMSIEAFCDEKVADLERKILELGANKVAAFIAEPIMASGGVIIPPDGYFKRCHAICQKHDVLFIADEVVTSFGRLGHYFASEDVYGVVPDLLTTAKGLTSGYVPMGALFISDRLIAEIASSRTQARAFYSGFTYSGHPVAAAAAMANLDIFEQDKLLEHVREISPHFEKVLKSLSDLSVVTDIRVKGLMAGIECELDAAHPDEDRDCGFALKVDKHCHDLGLLVRPTYNACVMSPALTITKAQIDELGAKLREGIKRAMAEG